jgi:hypothetical protein
MELFSPPAGDVLTSYEREVGRGEAGIRRVARAGRNLDIVSDSGVTRDLSDQFVLFQYNSKTEGPALLEVAGVEPKIDGSPEVPDVLVALEMLTFHIGDSERVDADTRATVRINFGKDESSVDRRFDTLFWSVAAGMNLYNDARRSKTEGKDLKADLHRAFGRRPIEIPGGLGRLSFEVIKHEEPKWWQRLFGFAQSGTGQALVSVLGFPAITQQAISVLDELLERLTDSKPETLFKSMPMRLALSKYAREEFAGGNPRVRIGALTRGFCIMTRGRDYDLFNEADVYYHAAYGKLVPKDVSDADLLAGKYEDPLRDVTYSVFRVGMKEAALDPTFKYS